MKPQIRQCQHSTALTGVKSEAAVAEYFRNRKLDVIEVGAQRFNHDLLVETFGRVQVKTCHLLTRKGPSYRQSSTTSKRLRCNLAAAGKRYQTDVIDWFAFVHWVNGKAMIWLVKENKLRATSEYLIACYSIALNSVMLQWESVAPTPLLMEAQ